MKKFLFHPRTIPFAFLVVCLIAYGLLVPWLGFFWDDWPYTWFAHTLGPLGLVKALANDRPFLAVSYMITTTLMGNSQIAWQIFAILTRWLSVLAFWWTLRLVWPRHLRPVTWVALLFAVYPGFQQHWVSVIYSQAYLLLAFTLFSLGLMVLSLRTIPVCWWKRPQYWFLTGSGLLLSAFSLFSTEYFFGIELIRPLLLWFALSETEPIARRRIRPVLLHWLPYFLLLAFFGIWRTFLFHAETYQVQVLGELSTNIGSTISNLLQTLIHDSFTGGLATWAQIFNVPHAFELNIRATQIYWLVIGISLALLLAYLLNVRYHNQNEKEEAETSATIWSVQAILVGIFAIAAAIIPFWAGGLPFDLNFPYNRFTLAMMPGSALLIAGLLESFVRTQRQKIVLVSILVSMAVGMQFHAANGFRRDWENMRSFFWQLSWRAPGLKADTMLLTYELPLTYYSDNSLSAPLNWIYAPDNHTESMPYLLVYLRSRQNSIVPHLEPNIEVGTNFRALSFNGNTSQSLSITYSPPRCLIVLDPRYNTGAAVPNLPKLLQRAIAVSNLNQILLKPVPGVRPPEDLFGKENQHTWCYYYEKADLARQLGQWDEIMSLWKESQANRLYYKDGSELLPFIEAAAHTGDWPTAKSLSNTVIKNNGATQAGLCETWNRLEQDANPDDAGLKIIQDIRTGLKCSITPNPK